MTDELFANAETAKRPHLKVFRFIYVIIVFLRVLVPFAISTDAVLVLQSRIQSNHSLWIGCRYTYSLSYDDYIHTYMDLQLSETPDAVTISSPITDLQDVHS